MAGETCDKHDDCITRINESINRIEVANATAQGKMEGFSNAVNEFLSSIKKDVYSKGGIMERVGIYGNQIFLQWGLLAAVILAIIVSFIKK